MMTYMGIESKKEWIYIGLPRRHSGKKKPTCQCTRCKDVRDSASIPGWGRSPGEAHGTPLQYSCLENPRDREAWWAIVHRVTQSQT